MMDIKQLKDFFSRHPSNAPRYTSYPPLPYWQHTLDQQAWHSELIKHKGSQIVDLYIHIPYCQSLCYYCGCFKWIKKDTSLSDHYVNLLLKEWELYKKHFPQLKISSLHFGGGTPTFLPAHQFQKFLEITSNSFTENFVGSCEVDPRTCTLDQLIVLKNFKFKRLSLGIQDFAPLVQSAINRNQSYDLVAKLIQTIRQLDFESINFDLIYGLPHQTELTFKKTLDQVFRLDPDLVALYSYAHVPWKVKNQNLIVSKNLPSFATKLKIITQACEAFSTAQYHYIGMDHFAKTDAYLYQAKKNQRLVRNFMGYTDKKEAVLIGLGISSISSTTHSYTQNTKNLDQYEKLLNQGQFPFEHSHQLSLEDKISDSIIHEIMCQEHFSQDLLKTYPLYQEILPNLNSLKGEGLIQLDNNTVKLTPLGQILRRNLALLFDHRYQSQTLDKNSSMFGQSI